MNAVVVYTSNMAAPKVCTLDCRSIGMQRKKISELSSKDLSTFDTIIYGGGLYAGGIAGFKVPVKT